MTTLPVRDAESAQTEQNPGGQQEERHRPAFVETDGRTGTPCSV
jgi:hypothetical protein